MMLTTLFVKLQDREIPEDDPRLLMVSKTYDRMNRFGNRPT